MGTGSKRNILYVDGEMVDFIGTMCALWDKYSGNINFFLKVESNFSRNCDTI